MADEQQFDWECNFCGQQEGVENGICPKCGPAQTTPLSKAAQIEAGVLVEKKEEVAQPSVEPTATER